MSQRITLILAIATLVILGSLSLASHVAWSWPLELITHFRVQYLVLSLIVSIVIVILWKTHHLKNKVVVFAALVLLGMNAIAVLPWYLPHSQQVAINSAKQIRVLSFNLNVQNKNAEEVINLVQNERPDIALFIEISQGTFDKLKIELKNTLTNGFRSPGGGLAILTRLPIKDVKGDNFNGKSGHNLIATLALDNKLIKFIGTHPLVPVKPSTFHRRNQQLAALSDYIPSIKEPLILVGDFNLTPWSPYYRRFVNKTNLHNTRLGFGVLPSWPRSASHVNLPSWLLPLMNIPIDHCFVSQQFGVARTHIGANANSDHASLITDLVLR
ncbi:MAG: endonuclease/exonuclease/phosphatase family protein [Goleter apudmare HA4340-LM2]|jgi:endonuclease/exonuclease/phosphatase (EEP) superfamily protein YafD|nr:endonuclease/exonuclease/phosphatase family protein [Goleter apudmare HA4340-LM2]